MRSYEQFDLAPSGLLDQPDLGNPLEGESFDRFEQQMDEALELLVARWIGLAAPASQTLARPSCLFGCGSAGRSPTAR
jgi:hypothetical protein